MKAPALTAIALGAAVLAGGASAETTSHFGLYEIHTFSEVGETTFTPPADVTADILVVAGGGAGGGAAGGGGGGGQVRILRGIPLTGGQAYSVAVGAGGVNAENNTWGLGANGGNSSFGEYVAFGGGGGAGCWAPAASNGGNGGGGTRGELEESSPGYPITNEVDQTVSGFAGGAAVGKAAGGGGGAGGPGQNGDPLGGHPSGEHRVAGAGGPGLACDFSGEVIYYGAGGGGGSNGLDCHQSGLAGLGGTGNGGEYNMYPLTGFAGTDGTGAGGGGGGMGQASPSAGGAGGSGIVIVRFVSPTDGTLPLAGPLAVSNVTATTAELAWRLVSDGGAGPCAVAAAYGYDADNCSRSVTLAESAMAGETTTTLTGLTPGRTYYLKLTATNAAGTGESQIISFATAAESVSTEKSPYAGLFQANDYYHDLQYDWNTGTWNYDPDPFTDVTSVRMPGVVMTNSRLPYADENGNVFYLPDFAIYTYGGYIYLEGGKTYALGKYFGQRVAMTVDGVEVFANDNGDIFAFNTFTVADTGWHAVHFQVGKKHYYYGPKGDRGTTEHWNSTLGFAYRADGSTAELPQTDWIPFVDPGDGSFLCTKLGFRTCAVDTWSVAGTKLNAALKYSAGDRAFALKAFVGATYGGENLEGWDDVVDLGSVAADATQGSAELTLPEDANYVRFALVDTEGDVLPGWSKTIALSDAADPSFGEAVAKDIGGVSANLEVTLGAKGSGVDSVGVTLLFGAAGEEAEIDLGDFTDTPTLCKYAATGLHPGMTYRYRFLAENDKGGKTSTPWAEFTTPAGSELGAEVSASLNQRQVSITGSLKTLGADVTTVSLMMGPDADHLEVHETFQPTAAGAFVRIFTGEFDTTYVYRFVSENACDGQTWTSQSNLGSFTVLDRTVYYSQPLAQGRWDDTANWIFNAADCVGYPVAGSTAIIQHQSENYEGENTLSKIEVTGDYALGGLTVDGFSDLSKPGYTAWLFSDPAEPKKLFAIENIISLARASNCKVIFDHLDFTGPKNTIYTSANCSITLTNGTSLSANSWPLVEDGSSMYLAPGTSLDLESFQIGGAGTRVTLDNARIHVTGNLLFGGNNNKLGGGELVIRGADSQVVFGNGFSPEALHEQSSRLVFDIPVGGYDQVPLVSDQPGGMEMFRWWYDGTTPFVIDIDPKSRVARGGTGDYQLIDCQHTIWKEKVTLGNVPNPKTDYFYWLPEDAEHPTQLWVHIKGNAGSMIFVR